MSEAVIVITHPTFGDLENPLFYFKVKTIMTHRNFWYQEVPRNLGLYMLIPEILRNLNDFRVLMDGVETKNKVFYISQIDRVYHIDKFYDKLDNSERYFLLGRMGPEDGKFSYITVDAKIKNSWECLYSDKEKYPIEYCGTIEIITTDPAKRLPINNIPRIRFDAFNLLKKDGVDVMDRIKCCRSCELLSVDGDICIFCRKYFCEYCGGECVEIDSRSLSYPYDHND